jgi:hypothetical protein
VEKELQFDAQSDQKSHLRFVPRAFAVRCSCGVVLRLVRHYTFTAECADPAGASIEFPGTGCNQVAIDYTALGSTSVFANARLIMETILVPALPPPFLFSGTFSLTDLDNQVDSIVGTLAGEGNIVGVPGPPAGFPPFGIAATFVATGGLGAREGASGISIMSGTAIFTNLSADTTQAGGSGSMTFAAVPEPSTGRLFTAAVPLLALFCRTRRKHR